MMTRFPLILLALISVSVLHAADRPLVALNFNETTEEGHFPNKGTLGGEGKLDALKLPKPEIVPGVTGERNDRALELAGEQMSTQTQYPKHSRVTLEVPEDLKPMSHWSLSMWFTAAEREQWQHVLFGWGVQAKGRPSSGMIVTLNPDAKGQPQFRVDVEGESFYSAPFEKSYGDAWMFVAMVFKEGELTIYTADRDKDIKPLYRPKQFETKAFTNIPAALYLGSADAPYSNLANQKGKIDNVLFYDRALTQEDISKLHQIGRRPLLP